MRKGRQWITVGRRSDLIPGCGAGAVANRRQIALFLLPELDNRLFAVSNYCPFSGVHIIARGIVGDIAGEPVVASPLYKQHFSLLDGRCIEQPEIQLETWPVRLQGDDVQVQMEAEESVAA
jgi:nitrite reductase (NADH) small subunit